MVATSDLEKASKLKEWDTKATHVYKRYKLEVNEDNTDILNLYFSMEELRKAIKKGGGDSSA